MQFMIVRVLVSSAFLFCLTACPSVPDADDSSTFPSPEDPTPSGEFYVYHDSGHHWNHYTASGWMGDIDSMELDDAYTGEVFRGETCQKWTCGAALRTEGWCGVVWQDPENNWDGDIPDAGYDLQGVLLLVFSARGEIGGEVVTFGFGGLEGTYPDSVPKQKKKVVLSTDWREFSIVVDHLDLSSVHNGFMWTIDSAENEPGDIAFYLDEVRYENQNESQSVIYKLPGICFSPFTQGKDPTDGDTATVEQVEDHMTVIAPYTKWVRTYGMDGGLAEAGSIAHAHDLHIAMGAWISRDAAANFQELTALVDKALAGEVDVAVIGNEVLHRRDLDVENLISLIEDFRSQVPNVPVTTAEVYTHWLEYPELVAACDQLYIQSYPFWDGVAIEQAVGTLHAQYNQVVEVAMGKPVWVSETGWSSDGLQVGEAVPSDENAAFYFLNVASWAQSLDIPVFYFEAFDEPFKAGTEPNEVGDHWGIFTTDLFLKNRMEFVFSGYTTFDYWIRDLPCGEGEPSIEFTYIPLYGSYDNLRGQVCHVWPADHAVAVYIYVSGWWTKPYFDRPLTWIQADGSFVTDITTGGIDQKATMIAAFLVSADYDPPSASGGSLPSSIQNDALAEIIVYR